MLQSLDIVIGLSVVMLVISMGITLITQAVLDLRHTRGRFLLQGLTDLLVQTHPNIGADCAKQIAEAILKHPIIRRGREQLGTAIKREELTQMLLEFASARVPAATAATVGGSATVQAAPVKENPFCKLPDAAYEKLTEAMRVNGLSNPGATLENIRTSLLELERTSPKVAAAERHATAILTHANTQLVGKIHSWFDQTMDRVSERFTMHARTVTLIASIIVVAILQLDTIALINRLSLDQGMRSELVKQSVAISDKTLASNQQFALDYAKAVAATGALRVPLPGEWLDGWSNVNPAGLFVSILLLSLGAPFWYKVLSGLVQLRSAIAQKDDAERQQRQSTQPAATGT
jgi:hypothetical protein